MKNRLCCLLLLLSCGLLSSCLDCKEQGEPDIGIEIIYTDTDTTFADNKPYIEAYGIGGSGAVLFGRVAYYRRGGNALDSFYQEVVIPLAINAESSSYVLVPRDESLDNDTITLHYDKSILADNEKVACGYYVEINNLRLAYSTLTDSLTIKFAIREEE